MPNNYSLFEGGGEGGLGLEKFKQFSSYREEGCQNKIIPLTPSTLTLNLDRGHNILRVCVRKVALFSQNNF